MLRRVLLSLLLMLAIAPAVVRADNSFGVNAGLALPVGDFKDAVAKGFNGGVNFTMNASEQVGFGVDLGYLGFGELDYLLFDGTDFIPVASKAKAIQATAFGKLNLSTGDMAPYLKAGAGLYHLKTEAAATDGSFLFAGEATENVFGVNLGAGIDWKAGGNGRFGLEGLYHIIMTEGSSTQAITVGAHYSFSMN